MIVSTMSKKEILAEITRDYAEVMMYCQRSASDYSKKYKSGKIRRPRFTHYKSKNKNEWLCHFHAEDDDIKYSICVYIPEENGYLVAYLIPNQLYNNQYNIIYYTKHFFDRYSERRNLSGNKFDSIQSFLLEDSYSVVVYEDPINDQVIKKYYKSQNGVILGYDDKSIPAFTANTFISKDMVINGQINGVDLVQEMIINTTADMLQEAKDKSISDGIEKNYLKYLDNLSW